MTELNLVHQMQLLSTEQCKQIWTHTSSPSPSSYIIISRGVFQHLSTSWTTHLNDPTDPHDKARGRTVVPVVLFMLRFIAKPRTFCPKTAGAKQFWQKHCQCGRWKKMVKLSITTLQGTNMSHVGGKRQRLKSDFWWDILRDMLLLWRELMNENSKIFRDINQKQKECSKTMMA